MKRYSFAIILSLLILAVATPEIPVLHGVVGVQEAEAQTKKRKRKSLFDVLFKRRESARKKRQERRARNQRQRDNGLPGVTLFNRRDATAGSQRVRNSAPAPKPAVSVVKNENAPKILVVGDFMATSLAKGLQKQHADNANIVFVGKGNASSGIVRNDVIDWPSAIPQMISENKPVAVIVLVGMNDRQQMRLPTGRVEKLGENWTTEYRKRITAIAGTGQAAGIPLIWVGLPPVKSGAMNKDYLTFNEMYRSIVESAGGTFVDVWDGFTNAEGKFVSAGPDVNGQIVRLRGSKGITMTRSGNRKLAFFADKALSRLGLISAEGDFNYAALGTPGGVPAVASIPEYDPAGTGKTITISFSSPALDGGDVLEGELVEPKPDEKVKVKAEDSESHLLVAKGELEKPQPGRIDANWGAPKEIKEAGEKPESAEKKDAETGATANSSEAAGQSGTTSTN